MLNGQQAGTYTITYDYNYLPNDIFEDIYDTTTFVECCGTGSITNSEISYSGSGKMFSVTSTEQTWYFKAKQEQPLIAGTTYTVSFEAKASTSVNATIGSEQGGSQSYDITTDWDRYTYTFTAVARDGYSAFVFYGWFGSDSRTLQIRNIQLQVGNLNTSNTTKQYNSTLGTLETPTRTGYTFLGWYTSPVGGTQVSSSTLVGASDVTYYAHWETNLYTVTLDNQNATTAGTTSTVAIYDSTMPSITVPTKTNYTFTGYYSTTDAVDLVSNLSTLTTTSSRISMLDSSNGWFLTSADAGTHLQGIITITDSTLTSAPTLDFNDKYLTESQYTVIEGSNGVWTYYIDFDITTAMLTSDAVLYETDYRFIDINNITTNSVINVNYLTKGGKKYYDNSGNSVWNYDVAANSTLYAGWKDTTIPTASVTTTTALNSTSQTATLTCSDNIGVTSYYWGTNSSPASSDFTSGTPSGTKSVTSAGVYYLFCKDAAGNVSEYAHITYYSYTVNNLLETVAGTTGTYTSANYTSVSSASYIAPSGTILTLASIYTAPTGSSASTFKGYSTAYSTSAATLSTTAPIIASETTYYMWFNRLTYALTLNKGTGISAVTGAGTYKYGKSVSISATASTGYTFSKWTVTSGNTPASTTAASTTVTITQATTLKAEGTAKTFTVTFNANGGSVSTSSKTVTYASTYGDLPTPTRSGATFLGWYTATALNGGSQITSSSTVSITAAQTLYARWQISSSVAVNLSRAWEQGDGTLTQTISTGVVQSATISGTLQSNATSNEEEDYRCDSTLYANDTQIDTIYSNRTSASKEVSQSLGSFSSGLVIKLLVHPHSTDYGSGYFNGTVTYTVLE